jgi:hypothetical protein
VRLDGLVDQLRLDHLDLLGLRHRVPARLRHRAPNYTCEDTPPG